MGTKTGHVMTLSNSIIGVGILAMPFCFRKCGIVLSIFLLIFSNFITRISCYYLVKSSLLCRRRSFEIMAFHLFGSQGKLLVELSIIGFLMGTCVTYFVVLGDLGPQMVSKILGFENNQMLRTWTMVFVTIFCVIPMGLLRNVDSLSAVCTASIGFYCCLVIKVMTESQNQFSKSDWMDSVEFWKISGVLQCLPIISMALCCQLQLFEVFETVQNVSLEKLYSVVKTATSICTGVYILVGFFGYIAYCTKEFSGNILLNFSSSFTNDIIKIGFVLSVAFSFPLVIFPCRASVYSLLYRRGHSDVAHYIPENRFRIITVALVMAGLVIGIMIPSVELVIGLVGSTIGVAICVIFPASCFIKISKKETTEKLFAQMLLIFGIILMVLGTYANLAAIDEKTSGSISPMAQYHDSVAKLNVFKNLSIPLPAKESETKKKTDQVVYVKEINLIDGAMPTIKYKVDADTKLLLLSTKTHAPIIETKKDVLKLVAITTTVTPNTKTDGDINKEAIKHEDMEIAIETKNVQKKVIEDKTEKLDETKKMLKEKVDEIKIELEKRNEETKKLVLQKFEQMVEKIGGQNKDETVKPIKVIQNVVTETPKNILIPPNVEVTKNDYKGNILLNKVDEIANRIDQLGKQQKIYEANQQPDMKMKIVENKRDIKQAADAPVLKDIHEAVMQRVDKIAERIDKIQQVQKTEEQLRKVETKADLITPKPIQLKNIVQLTTIIAPGPANVPARLLPKEDEKAHEILLKKVEEIVEKVEQIEQHQEKEMKIKQKNDENKDTNTIVLKRIEAIGEKLNKFEQMQKEQLAAEPKKITDNPLVNNAPLIPKNPIVEMIINNTNKDAMAIKPLTNTLTKESNRNVPPIPLLIQNNTKNVKQENQFVQIQQPNLVNILPNNKMKAEIKPVTVTVAKADDNVKPVTQIDQLAAIAQAQAKAQADNENIKAIRRDLLTVNDDNKENYNNKLMPVNLNQSVNKVKRKKREIQNDETNDCRNGLTKDGKLCAQYTELNIGKEFTVKVIGQELKSIKIVENVRDNLNLKKR